MPHMYPEVLNRDDVQSAAEYDLYHLFSQQLADDFHVYHDVAWLGRRRGRNAADGQADFIIVHPRIGVLVLEVKGGLVGYDGREGWYSINRSTGEHHAISDPFDQARDSKHLLLDKIRELNWPGRWPTIGHAVAFPDGTVDLPELGPDAPREIILLHNNRHDLDGWIRRCMGYWGQDGLNALGEDGVRILKEILARSWFLREPKLGEDINVESVAIAHYTDEQFQMLRLLNGRPRAAIRGCAGSGKTTIAMRKAEKLAREGFRVLLTCFNRNLANDLRRQTANRPRLKVQNFHALCQEYAAKTGFDRRPDWDDRRPDYFDTIMPEALLEAAVISDDFRFDAIIADEGQDFRSPWWDSLEMLLKDPKAGILYVFFDDNQLVYAHEITLPVEEMPFALTQNCRNTQYIHRAIMPYYRSDTIIRVRGPEGRPVESISFGRDNPRSLQQVLASTLARLIYTEKVASEDIVILSTGGLKGKPLAGMPVPAPFQLAEDASPVPNHIHTTTIRLFKGLESPVVILIQPEADASFNELMYVGQSRAKHHLILLKSEGSGN